MVFEPQTENQGNQGDQENQEALAVIQMGQRHNKTQAILHTINSSLRCVAQHWTSAHNIRIPAASGSFAAMSSGSTSVAL